jgi:hypothetical protein
MLGGPLVPYVVRRGDHLLKIALRMGFDADAIWQGPKNAALRATRPSMNLLCVRDVLYVPERPARAWMPIEVGSMNTFVAEVPTVHLAMKFAFEGKPLASEKCTIRELPKLGELSAVFQRLCILGYGVPLGDGPTALASRSQARRPGDCSTTPQWSHRTSQAHSSVGGSGAPGDDHAAPVISGLARRAPETRTSRNGRALPDLRRDCGRPAGGVALRIGGRFLSRTSPSARGEPQGSPQCSRM